MRDEAARGILVVALEGARAKDEGIWTSEGWPG